jgi:hypothetical protein
VSFTAKYLCVASRVFIVVVYFVIDSVRKLLSTPLYEKETRFEVSLGMKILVTVFRVVTQYSEAVGY